MNTRGKIVPKKALNKTQNLLSNIEIDQNLYQIEVSNDPNNSVKEDFEFWTKTGTKSLHKIAKLLADMEIDPFEGIGKPEPLKHNLQKCWSRRIDAKNRLVYKVEGKKVIILSARGHY